MKVGENPTGADPPKVTLPPPRYTVLQPPTQDYIVHCIGAIQLHRTESGKEYPLIQCFQL